MWQGWLWFSWMVVAAVGPAAPKDASDGDLVEFDGVYYQVKDGRLYTLDDPALFDPRYAVTVSGSAIDNNNTHAGIQTDTITPKDIEESGARTLGDVLATQAGIQVGSSLGLSQEASIDGLDGRHVLVLINGRPVTGRVNSRVDVSRLPVSPGSIERIEIIRGPASALYGNESMGGVINIITKKADPRKSLSIEMGGTLWQDSVSRTLSLHGEGGLSPLPLVVRGDVNFTELPSYDRGQAERPDTPDGKDDAPARRQWGSHLEVRVPLFDHAELNARTDYSASLSASQLARALPFIDRARNAELASGVGLSVDVTPLTVWESDFSITRFSHVFEKVPRSTSVTQPDAPFCGEVALPLLDGACSADAAVRTRASLTTTRLTSTVTHALFDHPPLSIGGTALDVGQGDVALGVALAVDYATRQNGDGDDTLPGAAHRALGSAFAEAQWRPRSWLSISPGVRVDGYVPAQAQQSGVVAPKLASKIDIPLPFGITGLSVRGSYGRGLRLPSFEERFLRFDHSELGYIVEGNALLLSETSHGFRTGIDFVPLRKFDASVEAYLNLVDNLINEVVSSRNSNGIPIFSYQNASRSFTSGILVRAKLGPFWGFEADGGYQYLINAVDASACPTSNPYFCSPNEGARSLPLRPAHAVNANLRYSVAATSTQLFVRNVVQSERIIDEQTRTQAYWDLTLGVRQPLGDNVELIMSLNNILDAYDAVYGPKPGRQANVLLRVTTP